MLFDIDHFSLLREICKQNSRYDIARHWPLTITERELQTKQPGIMFKIDHFLLLREICKQNSRYNVRYWPLRIIKREFKQNGRYKLILTKSHFFQVTVPIFFFFFFFEVWKLKELGPEIMHSFLQCLKKVPKSRFWAITFFNIFQNKKNWISKNHFQQIFVSYYSSLNRFHFYRFIGSVLMPRILWDTRAGYQ